MECTWPGNDPHTIAMYTPVDVDRLMADADIIRSRLKISGAIKNAAVFLKVQEEFESFSAYLWQFVGGKPIVNILHEGNQAWATSAESDTMSKDMRSGGLTFVGSTTCYAFMQGAGLDNDHLVTCPRHSVVQKLAQNLVVE
jgi:DNA-3-methyladenine glycosylase I